jgi:hypothetical protein
MKKFIYDMFSSKAAVSSKRVAAMITLVNIIILAYIATFRNSDHITPEFMFNGLCMIAGAGLGMTVLETIFSKNNSKPTEDEGEQGTTN